MGKRDEGKLKGGGAGGRGTNEEEGEGGGGFRRRGPVLRRFTCLNKGRDGCCDGCLSLGLLIAKDAWVMLGRWGHWLVFRVIFSSPSSLSSSFLSFLFLFYFQLPFFLGSISYMMFNLNVYV